MVNAQNALHDVTDNTEHKEGRITRKIEDQTAKVPSVAFLNLAFGAIAVSLGLAIGTRRPAWANFVGLWAPSFMLMGIYNKLVKQNGSDSARVGI